MPCICFGAMSGKEEFDRKLVTTAARNRLVLLQSIAKEIRDEHITMETEREDYLKAWDEAFSHMLHGCPEKKR